MKCLAAFARQFETWFGFVCFLVWFQFAVQAIDNGSPRRISQAYVYVTIERDAGAPIFSQVEYQTNIPENTAVNDTQPVLTVFANDADRKVCAWALFCYSNTFNFVSVQ